MKLGVIGGKDFLLPFGSFFGILLRTQRKAVVLFLLPFGSFSMRSAEVLQVPPKHYTFYSLLGVSSKFAPEEIPEKILDTFYSLLGVSWVQCVCQHSYFRYFLLPFGSFVPISFLIGSAFDMANFLLPFGSFG